MVLSARCYRMLSLLPWSEKTCWLWNQWWSFFITFNSGHTYAFLGKEKTHFFDIPLGQSERKRDRQTECAYYLCYIEHYTVIYNSPPKCGSLFPLLSCNVHVVCVTSFAITHCFHFSSSESINLYLPFYCITFLFQLWLFSHPLCVGWWKVNFNKRWITYTLALPSPHLPALLPHFVCKFWISLCAEVGLEWTLVPWVHAMLWLHKY